MTGMLREALRTAAQEAPPPAVTDGLWRRGRRRRRWRRTGAAVAGVLVVVALAGMPRLLLAGDPGPQVAVGDPGRSSLGRAYPWLPTHAEDPNGPAVAMFTGGGAGLLGPSGVLVGEDGSYRLLPVDDGSPGLLSPDGSLLARPGEIVDLRDGTRIGAGRVGRPVAWSPVGRRLLTVESRDPARGTGEDQVMLHYELYDVATGAVTFLMAGSDLSVPVAAFSPDGTRLAVVREGPGDRQLEIMDLPEGRHRIALPLGDHQRLAGAAAWTPDGRSVVLLAAEGCGWADCREQPEAFAGWRLQYVSTTWLLRQDDPVQVTDDPVRRTGLPGELVGWRDGRPVLVAQGERPTLVVAEPDGSARVLLTGPAGAERLTVPRELADTGTFGTYEADPWHVRWWVYALPPIALGAVLWVLWRRRRAQG